jgi:UDP-glucose:(heptosyl)LPS alpha-1,3-glucosyltransferase
MKIALVCHKYSIRKGGLERDTVLLSRELLKYGHEVHIFTNQQEHTDPNLIFHHVPMIRCTSLAKNLSFARNAQKELAGGSFDIVQGMDRILRQDIFRVSDGINPVQLIHRYPNPIIRRFFAVTPRRMALIWLEQQILQKGGCRSILAISRTIKEDIVRYYGVSPDKIRVIYNGVDTKVFRPDLKQAYRKKIREQYGIGENECLLLFISNDHKRKNLAAVLGALKLLRQKPIRLMVIGHDRSAPHQRSPMIDGAGQQVLFLGHQHRIEAFFGASDIFVFPSHYDAFGNVCLEAMASGLPVICSKTCGASELIRNGENGFILHQNRPEELAESISMLENRSFRNEIGARAATDAARYHTIEKHMDEVLDLYQNIIHMKKEFHVENIPH